MQSQIDQMELKKIKEPRELMVERLGVDVESEVA